MNRLIGFVALTLTFACTDTSIKRTQTKEPSDYDKLNSLCKSINDTINLNTFTTVIAISEMGGCIHCNQRFSTLMHACIENPEILFIISGTGTMIDISDYINPSFQNVIWDTHADFVRLGIAFGCAIISIKDSGIVAVKEVTTGNVNRPDLLLGK